MTNYQNCAKLYLFSLGKNLLSTRKSIILIYTWHVLHSSLGMSYVNNIYIRAKKKILQGVKTMEKRSWLDHKSKILVVDE